MTRLTTRQEQALLQLLKATKPLSCYEIGGATMRTMSALQTRGLVSSIHRLGSVAFPHTSIEWKLTKEGKRAAEGIAAR